MKIIKLKSAFWDGMSYVLETTRGYTLKVARLNAHTTGPGERFRAPRDDQHGLLDWRFDGQTAGSQLGIPC